MSTIPCSLSKNQNVFWQFSPSGDVEFDSLNIAQARTKHVTIGVSGEMVREGDETTWSLSSEGAEIAHTWIKLADWKPIPVVVIPNPCWISSDLYCLRNLQTGESVSANLEEGPVVERAVFIKKIGEGIITLTNGTMWTVGFLSRFGIYKKWKERDAVLLGGSRTDSPHYILINVNDNNWLPVELCLSKEEKGST